MTSKQKQRETTLAAKFIADVQKKNYSEANKSLENLVKAKIKRRIQEAIKK